MSNSSDFNRGYLIGIRSSDHSILRFDYNTTNGWGTVIPAAATFYFPFGGSEMSGAPVETVVHALSARWSAALAGTLSIEGTNFPRTFSGFNQGATDIADDDTTGAWQPVDITLAGMINATVTGTGNSITKFTVTLGGTNAGAAAWNIPDLGFRRVRAKLVCTTPGFLSLNVNSKLT